MAIKIRLRGKTKAGIADIKALVKHQMESGIRMDATTGKPFPALFIETVEIAVNGVKAVEAQWSGFVSKNPYLSLKVKANSGDTISIVVVDNTGATGNSELKLK